MGIVLKSIPVWSSAVLPKSGMVWNVIWIDNVEPPMPLNMKFLGLGSSWCGLGTSIEVIWEIVNSGESHFSSHSTGSEATH